MRLYLRISFHMVVGGGGDIIGKQTNGVSQKLTCDVHLHLTSAGLHVSSIAIHSFEVFWHHKSIVLSRGKKRGQANECADA